MATPALDVVGHSILTAAHIGAEVEARAHLTTAARHLRTVWPDAAEIVVDAGAWIDQQHGGGITLLLVRATTGIVLWSAQGNAGETGAATPPEPTAWPEHRQALERGLLAAADHASPEQQSGWQSTDLGSHPGHTALYRILLPEAESPPMEPSPR
ncbi:hypothetical protein ALI22I_20530 [Saccharothrix sp. ALI-22-I]|uniref:hypothetical protein n=1 Tax=Saccharothrix sp. ALI-22-I TaxID=1933778 RepID=UPI00097C62AA|nr:hypothetical protein [Saccharothrix sp. ALI-22-I]ONI88126.1 hypothetical protein ALI22I_20530 [Saccharothrix sp. ALI-22-I]